MHSFNIQRGLCTKPVFGQRAESHSLTCLPPKAGGGLVSSVDNTSHSIASLHWTNQVQLQVWSWLCIMQLWESRPSMHRTLSMQMSKVAKIQPGLDSHKVGMELDTLNLNTIHLTVIFFSASMSEMNIHLRHNILWTMMIKTFYYCSFGSHIGWILLRATKKIEFFFGMKKVSYIIMTPDGVTMHMCT